MVAEPAAAVEPLEVVRVLLDHVGGVVVQEVVVIAGMRSQPSGEGSGATRTSAAVHQLSAGLSASKPAATTRHRMSSKPRFRSVPRNDGGIGIDLKYCPTPIFGHWLHPHADNSAVVSGNVILKASPPGT